MNYSIGAFINRTFTNAIKNKTYKIVDKAVLYTVDRSCIGEYFYQDVYSSHVYDVNNGTYRCEVAKTSTNLIIKFYKPLDTSE